LGGNDENNRAVSTHAAAATTAIAFARVVARHITATACLMFCVLAVAGLCIAVAMRMMLPMIRIGRGHIHVRTALGSYQTGNARHGKNQLPLQKRQQEHPAQ